MTPISVWSRLATLGITLAALVISTCQCGKVAHGQDANVSARDAEARSVADWKTSLQSEDLALRRATAIATRTAPKKTLQQLLPELNKLLLNEKDGQVRLAVLDTVTSMGSSAASVVPALANALRNEFGGNTSEKKHQHYRAAIALAAIGKPAVTDLRSLLAEERENVRAEAAMALGRIGPDAVAAVDELVGLFADESDRVRSDAAIALGGIGAIALEPLLKAAVDERSQFRAGASTALGILKSNDPRAAKAVLACARDDDRSVRTAAIRSIAGFEVAEDVLMRLLLMNLEHEDDELRSSVVESFIQRPEILRKVEADLGRLLFSPDEGVTWHAAFLLKEIGAVETLLTAASNKQTRIDQIAKALALIGRPITERLIESLNHTDTRVRQSAALALGQLRPLPKGIVTNLADGLNDKDPQMQTACLTAIGFLGSYGREAVPSVRKKLKDDSPVVRANAIGILFAAAKRDPRLVDDFVAMVDDENPMVQLKAIESLHACGPIGQRALPSVIVQLGSTHTEVRVAAASMIGSHGSAAVKAVPALSASLSDADVDVRIVATKTLSQLGDGARPALSKLIRLLADENKDVRIWTVKTISNLELEPAEVYPHLSRALRDNDSAVRRQAVRGIQRLGRRGNLFIAGLIQLTANHGKSRSVTRLLDQFAKTATPPASVPALIELLKHKSPTARQQAINFLGLAGTAANEALADLRPLLKSADAAIAREAAIAIEKIGQ